MNKEDIIKFENEIAELYKQGKIKAPIHLNGGEDQADALIEIFRNIKPTDWIFSTWRNHWHWLLSGRDPEELKRQIVEGHSMHVFGERFFTSAIVGGIAPIAVGVAYGLKKRGSTAKVWCFLGDMGASTGIAMESMRYACGHELPINFVIEDNGLSVKTDTLEAWGCGKEMCIKETCEHPCWFIGNQLKIYEYKRQYPHAGCGVFVLF